MSNPCMRHGWQHLHTPCPECEQESNSARIAAQLKREPANAALMVELIKEVRAIRDALDALVERGNDG